MKYIKLIQEQPLWNAGYCQHYDFSLANSCEESRIEAIIEIAKVCRGDKPIANPEKLYQQLLTEHAGKPGEIFQFIPCIRTEYSPQVVRFGYTNEHNEILTNLRACLEDGIDYDFDKQIKGFHVFKLKIPLMIVPQILRHGQLSFMQQSERHCKLREYYYCEDFKQLHMPDYKWNWFCNETAQVRWDEIQHHFDIRQELTNKGSHGLAYTTLWIAGWEKDPSQWKNFFDVRTVNPTQIELQQVAKVMKEMMYE